MKVLADPVPSSALDLYADFGALPHWYPELAVLPADRPRWTQALGAVDAIAPSRGLVRLSRLLAAVSRDAEERRVASEALLARLRFSTADRRAVTRRATAYLPFISPVDSSAEHRRWLAEVGDAWRDVIRLHLADARSAHSERAVHYQVATWRQVHGEWLEHPPLRVGDLAISGEDILELGLQPGPLVGLLLEELLEQTLEDPDGNEREALLDEARRLIELGSLRPKSPMPDEPSLFTELETGDPGARADGDSIGSRNGDRRPDAPLASRMRPRALEEFEGQEELVGEGRPLRELIESGRVPSLIFWGPPGSGKTTLAGLLAERMESAFVPFSAVTDGIPRVRRVLAEAKDRRRANGRGTLLFVDEIHRFNRAQQDALLPHVERGAITLIGATTENPSFEVVGPLLSRTRVLVLTPLSPEAIARICRRALEDHERGLGARELTITDDALQRIATECDGDARRALNALETASDLVAEERGEIDEGRIEAALQKRFARYDKSGEEHFNLISALHKSVRGSDVDAALYWLARMLDAGEDPMYLARRLVRMAVEDIGLADPAALRLTLAARDAYHFLGSPEGDLALAEATAYLALAPKSNAIYRAYGRALAGARDTPAASVPLHLRNAPTRLMKDLGYGADYRYDHDHEAAVASQSYLPDELGTPGWYVPTPRGWEVEARRRLEAIRAARERNEEGG